MFSPFVLQKMKMWKMFLRRMCVGTNEALRSKLRDILRSFPKPRPSFAKAAEGSPRFHPRSELRGFGKKNSRCWDEEKAERLRDVLMAFRLRIASQATLSPLIDFPAMLALPPGGVPQPVPLFALIQPDEQNRAAATLLLPDEVSATIIPMN